MLRYVYRSPRTNDCRIYQCIENFSSKNKNIKKNVNSLKKVIVVEIVIVKENNKKRDSYLSLDDLIE